MEIYTFETKAGLIQKGLVDGLKLIFRQADRSLDAELKPVSGGAKKILLEFDGKSSLGMDLWTELGEGVPPARVLIATDSESIFAKWCKLKLGHAKWGCSDEMVSIDYSDDNARLSNQLHECLHFFGVDDCYDDKSLLPKSSCKNINCVMRYGKVSSEVCEHVLSQIRDWSDRSG